MKQFIELLKNRRIWVFIISSVMFLLTLFGYQPEIDTNAVTEMVINLTSAIANALIAILAIASYLKPKIK